MVRLCLHGGPPRGPHKWAHLSQEADTCQRRGVRKVLDPAEPEYSAQSLSEGTGRKGRGEGEAHSEGKDEEQGYRGTSLGHS